MVIEPANNGTEQPEYPATPTLLDSFLEQEGVLGQLRQRIANLEQFRELYLSKETSSATTPATHTKNDTQDEQAQTILTLERQIQELNGCQSVLESELDRLSSENEGLKAITATSNESDEHEAPTTTEETSTAVSETSTDTLESLREEVNQAMDTAFGAMRSNADLGGVIHLLTRSFECSTTEELGKLVLETIGNYNLKGIVAFAYSGKKEYFGTIDPLTDEDKSLMLSIPQDTIITESATHLMFHTDFCDLLIWDFDSTDFKAFNDLKDTLRMLAVGVNAGALRVISELAATKERTNLERLVMTTQKNLKGIDAKQKKEVSEISGLATTLIANIKGQLSKIPGDSDKKQHLVNTISQELVKMEKVVREASFIDDSFKNVIEALTSSLSKQKPKK